MSDEMYVLEMLLCCSLISPRYTKCSYYLSVPQKKCHFKSIKIVMMMKEETLWLLLEKGIS